MEPETKAPDASNAPTKGQLLKLTINYKKQAYPVEIGDEETLGQLRQVVHAATGVLAGLQKLMLKGMLKDDNKTLKELGVTNGAKIMLIGSSIDEVMVAAAPPPEATSGKFEEPKVEEPLSEQVQHKKIIEKGVPEGAEPGKRGKHENLPDTPLSGILNHTGVKVRLTFKLWTEELWIQSASSTQKIPFASIRKVTSEPIKGNEDYHIVGLQLGQSEKSKYYLYFVPAQYTRAIRTVLTGDFFG